MEEAQAATVAELTSELELQLLTSRERREKAERDVAKAQAEWDETRKQMTEDLASEVEVRVGMGVDGGGWGHRKPPPPQQQLTSSVAIPAAPPPVPTRPQALHKGYQKRLDDEREAALKYKGENGIMKKKFGALMREMDDNKDEIKARREGLEGQRRTIDGLEKEIGMLR
jgi:cilia- and flagella-associated protein 57